MMLVLIRGCFLSSCCGVSVVISGVFRLVISCVIEYLIVGDCCMLWFEKL